MFCFQCQETSKNEGCTVRGVCGKNEDVANLQDLLIYLLKGISYYEYKAGKAGIKKEIINKEIDDFIVDSLFATITNVNFDEKRFEKLIEKAINYKENIKNNFLEAYKEKYNENFTGDLPEMSTYSEKHKEKYYEKGQKVGVLKTENKDIRSLRELLTYGLKGVAAYLHHAKILGYTDKEIRAFIKKALAATADDNLSIEDLIEYVMKCGETAVNTMALLDKANTESYGHPEPTEVNIGVNNRPGILVSGHDLKDFKELLEQTKDEGIDIYTHGEMLPANSYPEFKKYDHFVGNYGNSWWKQDEEFEKFNGPILMTTNCLTPPKESYKDRVYTTDVVGYPGLSHISDRKEGESKDFSPLIEHAKKCEAPEELENGTIPGGFAHHSVLSQADKIIKAIQEGDIKRFVVMAGCDGRFKSRNYFTEVAQNLPNDTIILTAGCAKYRYNKLELGDISGIPRILDAGQCNDSYSLVVIAQKLAEAMDIEDINELPISYDIAWYEQKAVAVLLALLSLGVKGIRLGPTLPAFISENVLNVLVDKFNIKPTGKVEEDIKAIMNE
ncbi:MAG: hydroxylamine reductase [Halanaerobiales bacterium]